MTTAEYGHVARYACAIRESASAAAQETGRGSTDSESWSGVLTESTYTSIWTVAESAEGRWEPVLESAKGEYASPGYSPFCLTARDANTTKMTLQPGWLSEDVTCSLGICVRKYPVTTCASLGLYGVRLGTWKLKRGLQPAATAQVPH